MGALTRGHTTEIDCRQKSRADWCFHVIPPPGRFQADQIIRHSGPAQALCITCLGREVPGGARGWNGAQRGVAVPIMSVPVPSWPMRSRETLQNTSQLLRAKGIAFHYRSQARSAQKGSDDRIKM